MKTYSKYFQATANLFGNTPADRNEAYSTIYGYFAAANNVPPLLDQLLNLFEAQAAGALGIFVADTLGESRLRLVHGLWTYPVALAQASANKGKAFGYMDDIEGDAGELVQVNSDMLAKTQASQVFSLGHHIATFLLDSHGKGLTLRQAMGTLYPYLNHHGLVGTCAPLFEILQVAGTFPSYLQVTQHSSSPAPPFEVSHSQLISATWGPLYTNRLLLLCGKKEEATIILRLKQWVQK
eukprot:jgi/Psemu1/44623/gm1.44623_g